MTDMFLSARLAFGQRPRAGRAHRLPVPRVWFDHPAGKPDHRPNHLANRKTENAMQDLTNAPSALAATFGAFHPRRLRQSPVIFATVLAATIIGVISLRALIAGAPEALPGLELSCTLWVLAFVALGIEVLVDRPRHRKAGPVTSDAESGKVA